MFIIPAMTDRRRFLQVRLRHQQEIIPQPILAIMIPVALLISLFQGRAVHWRISKILMVTITDTRMMTFTIREGFEDSISGVIGITMIHITRMTITTHTGLPSGILFM